MSKIDLHIHSTFSDGTFTPHELLDAAHNLGFSTIAITDHDCVDGYLAGRKHAKKLGIELIPGVEVSTYFMEYDVHILAYFIDPHNRALKKMLKYHQNSRVIRAQMMLEKLEKLGIHISMNQLLKQVDNPQVIGRPHVANAMLEVGAITTYEQAFYEYIGNGKPAYVRKPTYEPRDVIRVIHEAGGLAILAHPGVIKNDFIIPDLVDMGIDGLEVFYSYHSTEQREMYLGLTSKYDLVATGGSDFHGLNRQQVDLGKIVLREEYLQALRKAANKRKILSRT